MFEEWYKRKRGKEVFVVSIKIKIFKTLFTFSYYGDIIKIT